MLCDSLSVREPAPVSKNKGAREHEGVSDAMSSETEGSGKPAAAMEEVLSSIKQIIDEDKAGHAPTATSEPATAEEEDEEVLELTELEEDSGEEAAPITSIFEKRPSRPDALRAVPPRTIDAVRPQGDPRANPAVVAQLKGLREAAKIAKGISSEGVAQDGRFEPYVVKAIQPLVEAWAAEHLPKLAEDHIGVAVERALRDWMDRNLEAVVERVVREEVQAMVAQVGED